MILLLGLLLGSSAPTLVQDDLDPPAAPVSTRVREAAIFKDGHAFVVSEAILPPKAGWYVTYDVPEAILGTLWTSSTNPKARIEAVRAGWEVFDQKGPCLALQDVIESALGQEVLLTLGEGGPQPRIVEGTVLEVPELAPDRPAPGTPPEPRKGETITLKSPSGIEVVRRASILSIRFKKEIPLRKSTPTVRRRILFKVATDPALEDGPLAIRFVYVQKGLRWIPEYRAEVLPGKKVKLSLQATIVNDLVDLRGIQASLVVGIPNFLMKDTLSPLALREVATRLAHQLYLGNPFDNNAVASQLTNYQSGRMPAPGPAPAEAQIEFLAKGSSADEYFLYSRGDVTLKSGERGTYPIFEGTFDYEDAYTLKINPAPPRHWAAERMEELRQALLQPKVMHGLKIHNSGRVPFTTGPAMIVREGRSMAQDLLRFTPAGGEALLPIAELADVSVRLRETETSRVNNLRIDGELYTQVFVRSTVCLLNSRKEPIQVEVDRIFLGSAAKVDSGGSSEALDSWGVPPERFPGGAWPGGWFAVNGLFRASWKVTLESSKTAELGTEWSYYRR